MPPIKNGQNPVLDEIKGIGLNRFYRDRASELPCQVKPRFPITQYNFKALSREPDPSIRFVAGMATMPSRLSGLERVINRVLPQINELHIFLNNIIETPWFLANPKIIIHRSSEYGDLRDNGKFFGLQYARGENDIYFTLDDDIIYPHGYFNYLHNSLVRYSYRAAIGVHGVIYPASPNSFFQRYVFNFQKQLCYDLPVSVLGTGTTAFKASLLDFRELIDSQTGMADLVFSSRMKAHSVPLICLARPRYWLTEINDSANEDSIYLETSRDQSRHLTFLRSRSPWGIRAILESIRNANINQLLPIQSLEFLNSLYAIETKNATNYQEMQDCNSAFLECGELIFCNRANYRSLAESVIRSSTQYLDLKFNEFHQLLYDFICTKLANADPIKTNQDFQDAILILQYYQNESCDRYTWMLLEVIQSSHVSAEIISTLICYFDDDDLLPLMNSLLRARDISPEVAMCIQRNLLLVSPLLANSSISAFSKDTELDSPLSLLLGAIYYIDNPQQASGMLKIFANRRYEESKKNRDVRLFISALVSCGKSMPLECLKLLIESNNLSIEAKLNICKHVVNMNWSSSFYAKELISRNVFVKGDVIAEISEIEDQLLLAQCAENPTSSVLKCINSYNSCHSASTLRLEESSKGFWGSLRGAASISDVDFGLCTVIITAYDAISTIEYSIKSILSQTYKNIEIVLVDDGKNTGLDSIVCKFDATNIKIIVNTKNSGPYKSRNIALSTARGKFIAIQDADDWSHPQRLSRQLSLLCANPRFMACFAKHIRFDANGSIKLENNSRFLGDGPMTSVFRADAFRSLGVFKDVRTRGDMEYIHRLVTAYGENALCYDPAVMVFSLDWESNSKRNIDSNVKKTLLSEFKKHYTLFNSHMLIFSEINQREQLSSTI